MANKTEKLEAKPWTDLYIEVPEVGEVCVNYLNIRDPRLKESAQRSGVDFNTLSHDENGALNNLSYLEANALVHNLSPESTVLTPREWAIALPFLNEFYPEFYDLSDDSLKYEILNGELTIDKNRISRFSHGPITSAVSPQKYTNSFRIDLPPKDSTYVNVNDFSLVTQFPERFRTKETKLEGDLQIAYHNKEHPNPREHFLGCQDALELENDNFRNQAYKWSEFIGVREVLKE